ncbi:MAG: efflux RND transporter permease subunit [Alistipes sp.]|nr:efflux RND transporter permease subunit [Alistipes sp.]
MKDFFIKRPIAAISLSVIVLFLGIISIFDLSIEQYPDITPPVVEVSATYSGADAVRVSESVATPIAQNIMGVSNMLYMEAVSGSDGTMNLQVTFAPGTDPDMNAVAVENNVSAATALLPQQVVEQGVVTRKSQTGFIMVYAITSDGRYDEQFVSNYAYINLQNRLLMVDGVGKVQIMGASEYAMRVWLKPDVLEYYNLSVADITNAIAVQSAAYPVGQFGAEPAPEGTQYTYTVTLPEQFSTAEQFEDIVIKSSRDGKQVKLGQVADVSLGVQSYGTSSLFDGRPTAVMVVYQEPGSNAVAVAERVRAQMEVAAESFPDGIGYTTIVDGTQSIRAGIEEIALTLLASLLLVVAIIFLFIQDWRATIIPVVAIPVSIVGTFIAFPLFGLSINVVSLLALVLAIGLVVDDAIVVVEAVQVGIESGLKPFEATVSAMGKVSGAVIATSVVLLAVFVPVSFTGGITGKLFQQFGVTISVAVFISTICALTLTPALCALLLRPQQRRDKGLFGAFNRGFESLKSRYLKVTDKVMVHTKATAMAVVVTLVGIVVLWRVIPSGFLPNEDQGYVMVAVTTPAASSLQVTERSMARVNSMVCSHREVESSAVVAGFNMLSGSAATNSGVIFVKLKPYSERTTSAEELAVILSEELAPLSPQIVSYAFIQPAIPGLGVVSGVTFALTDREGKGNDYLAQNLDSLLVALNSHPQIESAVSQFDNRVPQKRIVVDRAAALMKGVELSELYDQLSAMLGGRYIDNFTRFGRLYRSYIAASGEFRVDSGSLESYFVTTSDGQSIPLSTLVSVEDNFGVAFERQFNLYRAAEVTVTPKSGVSTGQAMEIISSTATEVLPTDMGIEWSGTTALESSEGGGGNLWVYIISIIFVFLILSMLYESYSLPVAIVAAVPLALLGALLFIAVAHLMSKSFVVDIYTQISLVMLIGLAAKNSILVVEYASTLQREGKSLSQATLEAAAMRLRPIVMTAAAFILGSLPLILASGVYSTARNIMGTALVGGMVTATTLGVVLYPALYYLIKRVLTR